MALPGTPGERYSRCANPQPSVGTQELPETDGFDTDLFSRHSGKGYHGTKSAD